VRTSTIMVLIAALGVFLALVALGFGVYVDHSGGKFWFYWIASLLMLGLGLVLIALTLGYWLKVMRLEVKGRPRSD